ncbi:unnamed protein product [Blepharisma stoltei]|uniref:Uncharacterized protein n=1 Tax=Blepharisma stoltei TaxID=1481888 RepID=A0AAU9K638_9CILI|nr:unnamed protein product [Blepharisma stoltei]
MSRNPLKLLKDKLDSMKRDRDYCNSQILQERAKLADLENELYRLQTEYQRSKSQLDEKEAHLQRFNETIRESENAYNKLLISTDKLITSLDHESQNVSRKFNRNNKY